MFLDEMILQENDNTLFGDAEIVVEKRQFCEGVDGLLEVALESEMSWNNIVMDTIKEEFVAIKNESAVLLEEAKTNWFKQIIAWIKDKAQKVAAFFKNLIAKLMAQMTNVDKFVANNGPIIAKLADGVTATTYTWERYNVIDITNDRIGKLMKLANVATKEAKNEDELAMEAFTCKVKELTTKLAKECRSEEKASRTYTANEVKTAFVELRKVKAEIGKLKETQNSNSFQLNAMKKKAEAGLKSAGEGASDLKNQIITIKNVNSLTDKVTASGITLLNQCLNDMIIVCRAGVSKAKGAGKAADKEAKKAEKDAKKNESTLFELI